MHKLQKPLLSTFTAEDGVVAGTNVYYTQFTPIDSFTSYMMQIAWEGEPEATVELEFSADPVPPLGYSVPNSLPQPIFFDTVPGTTQTTVDTNIISYDVVRTSANWVRLKWTNLSGAGVVVSIQLVAKGSMI